MPKVDPVSLLLMLPLLGAAGAFLLKFRRAHLWAGGVVGASLMGGTLVSLLAAGRVSREGAIFRVIGGWRSAVGIHLNLDGAAAVLLIALFAISLLVLLYALGEGAYGALFYATYAVAVAGMVGVILSADLFNLFVFFEVLSLSATILIAYKRGLTGLYAAFRYLLVTGLSVVLYLLGVFLLYRESGELALSALLANSGGTAFSDTLFPGPVGIAGVLLFTGVAIRVALVPFHVWLPDAHSQAPHPVSALLSGLMIKAAFLALWRMVTLFTESGFLMELLLITGLGSALLGVFLALAQKDAKRLLAFHSISQMGYIAAAAGAGLLTGALYHALGHALFKTLLFLSVGYYISRTGSRDLYRMGDAAGSGRSSRTRRELLPPLLLLVGAAAIAGVPPFTGFASKALIGSGMKGSQYYALLRLVSVGTAASFIKLCRFLLPLSGSGGMRISNVSELAPTASQDPKESSASRFLLLGSMVAVAILTLLLGVFPGLVLGGMSALGLPISGEPQLIYTPSRIAESLIVLALGALLYWALRSGPGKRVSQAVSELRLGVDGALGVMALGVVLAAAPLFF